MSWSRTERCLDRMALASQHRHLIWGIYYPERRDKNDERLGIRPNRINWSKNFFGFVRKDNIVRNEEARSNIDYCLESRELIAEAKRQCMRCIGVHLWGAIKAGGALSVRVRFFIGSVYFVCAFTSFRSLWTRLSNAGTYGHVFTFFFDSGEGRKRVTDPCEKLTHHLVFRKSRQRCIIKFVGKIERALFPAMQL